MAVIGVGTTSRVSVEDVLAIIAVAKAKVTQVEQERLQVPPHPGPLPEGRGRKAADLATKVERISSVLSPLGERDRVRGSSYIEKSWCEGGPVLRWLAALDRPALNGAVEEAARRAGLDLILLTLDELRAAAHGCVTHSEKSMKQYGIPSVAEASALAAAGASARLFIPRFCGRNTTASVAIVP
jgi:cobalt-precorrin 5A hydrolase